MGSSAGVHAADAGTESGFCASAKYVKGGRELQSNAEITIQSDARVYRVAAGAMSSLTVQPDPSGKGGAATLMGDAVIEDVTDPHDPVAVDDDATLLLTLADGGGPSAADTVGITVWNKDGGLWFSSHWDGTETVEQAVASGSVTVH